MRIESNYKIEYFEMNYSILATFSIPFENIKALEYSFILLLFCIENMTLDDVYFIESIEIALLYLKKRALLSYRVIHIMRICYSIINSLDIARVDEDFLNILLEISYEMLSFMDDIEMQYQCTNIFKRLIHLQNRRDLIDDSLIMNIIDGINKIDLLELSQRK